MKIPFVGAMAAILTLPVMAETAEKRLVLWLSNAQIAGQATVNNARAIARAMFRQIDVRVEWRLGGPEDRAFKALCDVPSIAIVFDDGSPRRFNPKALAYARPHGKSAPSIHVLYDRLQRRGRVEPDILAPLLAHVIVHEVTHVLQGVGRHSDSGIMKAAWTRDDYSQMKDRPLAFARNDIDLIHAGFGVTVTRSCSAIRIEE